MRSEGHIYAHKYPLWMVWEEALAVKRRINRNIQTQATVMLMAMGTAQTGGRKATATFTKFLENFTDGEDH